MVEQPLPPVIKWYRIYCIFMTVLYFLVLVMFTSLFWIDLKEVDLHGFAPAVFYAYLGFIGFLSLVLAAAYLLALTHKTRPWLWTYGVVLICIGFTSVCTFPAAIPLLIYWFKPETKAYFGKN